MIFAFPPAPEDPTLPLLAWQWIAQRMCLSMALVVSLAGLAIAAGWLKRRSRPGGAGLFSAAGAVIAILSATICSIFFVRLYGNAFGASDRVPVSVVIRVFLVAGGGSLAAGAVTVGIVRVSVTGVAFVWRVLVQPPSIRRVEHRDDWSREEAGAARTGTDGSS